MLNLSKTKELTSNIRVSTLACILETIGCTLIGFGVGFILQAVIPGFTIGLGAGFMLAALIQGVSEML